MRGQEVSKRRPLARLAAVVALAAAVLLLAAPVGAVVVTGSWVSGPDAVIATADGGKGKLDVLEPGVAAVATSTESGSTGSADRVVKEWVATGGGSGGGSSKGK